MRHLNFYLNNFWEGSVEETINNILYMSETLFGSNYIEEIDNIIKQAQCIGVEFCEECGFAKKDNECYICNKKI